MKTRILFVVVLILSLSAIDVRAAQDTSFTYQGRMVDAQGQPLSGPVNLAAHLYGAAGGGTPIASQEFENVTLTSGMFSLRIDFGDQFVGDERWIEIVNHTHNVTFARQHFSSTPYALFAQKAGTLTTTLNELLLPTNAARLSANQIFLGSNIFSGVLCATNPANKITGTFTGSGGGLSNLPAAYLTGFIADSLLSSNIARVNGSNSLAAEIARAMAEEAALQSNLNNEVTARQAATAQWIAALN